MSVHPGQVWSLSVMLQSLGHRCHTCGVFHIQVSSMCSLPLAVSPLYFGRPVTWPVSLWGGRESRRTQGCCQTPHSQRRAISCNRTKGEIVSGGTLQAGVGMEGGRHVGVRGAWDSNLARTNGQVRGAMIDCHTRGVEVSAVT